MVHGCKVNPLLWSIFFGQNADLTSGRDCITFPNFRANRTFPTLPSPGASPSALPSSSCWSWACTPPRSGCSTTTADSRPSSPTPASSQRSASASRASTSSAPSSGRAAGTLFSAVVIRAWPNPQVGQISDCCAADFGPSWSMNQLYNSHKMDKLKDLANPWS